MRTLIVEDEFHSREALKNLVSEFCQGVEIIDEATGAKDATDKINALSPELVFMDIELGDGTAFDVLKSIGTHSFHLVFTTAFDHYAIRAIKFNALDYLLKPIDIEELQAAVEKAKQASPGTGAENLKYFIDNLREPRLENPVITLSTSDSFEYVPVKDILRCEAQGAYTNFFIRDKASLLVSKTLKEYAHLLEPYSFFRIHQSHLINLSEVERYIKTDGGYIVLKDSTRLGVSRSKRDDFLSAMKG